MPTTSWRSCLHCARSACISCSLVFGLLHVCAAQPSMKPLPTASASFSILIRDNRGIRVSTDKKPSASILLGSIDHESSGGDRKSKHFIANFSFSLLPHRTPIAMLRLLSAKTFPPTPFVHSAPPRADRYDPMAIDLDLRRRSTFLLIFPATLPTTQEAL